MLGALRKTTTLTRLMHNPTRHSPPHLQQSKAYLRKAKDTLSPSATSSSSAATSSSGLVAWYLSVVKSHPVLTKSVTASLIYTAADLSSQSIAKSEGGYDTVRTLRMGAYGMLILGPSLHFWFNFMAKTFPKRDMLSTLKKMAMGQGVYGPTMTVVFFSYNAFLQGETGVEVLNRLK